MYSDLYSEEIVRKLAKIKKKEPKHYEIIRKKMDDILQNPQNKHKFLHYNMKGINRAHIGHFVLIFRINHQNKTISFEDYDHHDKIYR
ncbi:MAG: type II toxin-antitoxin system RelE/ParE family toxin [Nanoarchaeota archaeon]